MYQDYGAWSYDFCYKNKYIESNLQKGFWDVISGCTEHIETHIINHTRKKQRSLTITLLELKNAFGEVSHDLLISVLKYHHIICLVKSFYTDYQSAIATDSYVASLITVSRRFLLGDSLSPLLFNLVIKTFINTIKQVKINLRLWWDTCFETLDAICWWCRIGHISRIRQSVLV